MAKNNKKSESVFKGNEVMMMLEQMQGGISIIAEEQKSMRNDMDRGFKKLRSDIDGEFKKLRSDMDGEFKKLRSDMNEGFKKVDERFDSVFEFLSSIEDGLVDLRKEINILKETKADKDYVINFDKRIGILEKKFKAMQAEQSNA